VGDRVENIFNRILAHLDRQYCLFPNMTLSWILLMEKGLYTKKKKSKRQNGTSLTPRIGIDEKKGQSRKY
jgi:hypothetical protein